MKTGTARMWKVVILLSATIAAFAGGYSRGRNAVLIAEFKVYYGNLVARTVPADSPLADFLKARYYYLANRIPNRELPLPVRDFGPVTNDLARALAIGKGPTRADAEYQSYRDQRLIK